MKQFIQFLCFLLTSQVCFAQRDLVQDIDAVFNQYASAEHVYGAVLQVYSASRDIDVSVYKNNPSSNLMDAGHQPFYTASITKLLTATAIGILKDRKQLDFDDTIDQYLPEALIDNLHVLDGNDYSNTITIAQLLQHTAGLPDYFTDSTMDGSPNIINQLLIDQDNLWAPQDLIRFTKETMRPHFVPGQGYHYTDTDYVLLALIIENVSGVSLDGFFKHSIFEPLGMEHSYVNLKSDPIKDALPIAAFYVGDIELSSFKSLSADWGGGGLVSTTQDLIRFFKAYNNDQIIKQDTRLEMQHWVHETVGMTYGFGIRKVSLKDRFHTATALHLIGHTGSTASFLWYCPQLDTYIAGTLNQLEASKQTLSLVYKILKTIQNKQ